MLHNRSTGFWIAISFFGMMTGTVFGEAMAAVLPESSTALKSFFGGALEFSIGPFGFDLVVLRFALEEIAFKLNLMSFAGLMFVGYLYRWF
ncbi:MAG: hypothetical protein JXA64_00900 [Candidatus Fermentibacteraceae bacterium]|nr:hypothetical protein [Candidatus Fermentibacteraceae bacterium]MBN2607644.1 hypothetical protein [Candidatus Fermentibacteraceae bacterium]